MPKKAPVTVDPAVCEGENCVHIIKGSQHVGSKQLGVFEVMSIAVVAYLSVMLGVILSMSLA